MEVRWKGLLRDCGRFGRRVGLGVEHLKEPFRSSQRLMNISSCCSILLFGLSGKKLPTIVVIIIVFLPVFPSPPLVTGLLLSIEVCLWCVPSLLPPSPSLARLLRTNACSLPSSFLYGMSFSITNLCRASILTPLGRRRDPM